MDKYQEAIVNYETCRQRVASLEKGEIEIQEASPDDNCSRCDSKYFYLKKIRLKEARKSLGIAKRKLTLLGKELTRK